MNYWSFTQTSEAKHKILAVKNEDIENEMWYRGLDLSRTVAHGQVGRAAKL